MSVEKKFKTLLWLLLHKVDNSKNRKMSMQELDNKEIDKFIRIIDIRGEAKFKFSDKKIRTQLLKTKRAGIL